MTRGLPRESLNLRVLADLKRQVEHVAQTEGVPINSAAVILLQEGYRTWKRRRKT